MKCDVIIVGAGVLGVSLAYHLSIASLRVIVLEREALPAAHASGKNAGMMRQLYRHPQLTDWATRSINTLPQELKESCFEQCGSLIVDRTVPAHHSELFEQRSYRPPDSETLPAVYTKTDGLLDSPRYVHLLYGKCDRRFCEFRFHQNVTQLEHTGNTWHAHTADGSIHSAPLLVNAAGAWVTEILAANHPELLVDAVPYARHLFVMRNWKEQFMPAEDCGFFWEERNEWYIRKWDKNSGLVSICERIAVSSPETFVPSESVRHELAEKLLNALPNCSQKLELAQSWHCFRTYTEDQLPIWGTDPRTKGLFWLAAFGGFGMSTSFAAASDAAEVIAGNGEKIIPDFSPGRRSVQPELRMTIAGNAG